MLFYVDQQRDGSSYIPLTALSTEQEKETDSYNFLNAPSLY